MTVFDILLFAVTAFALGAAATEAMMAQLRCRHQRQKGPMTSKKTVEEILAPARAALNEGLVTYLAIVEGLFAMRSVRALDPSVEAHVAEIANDVFDTLAPEVQEPLLDPRLIEDMKVRWTSDTGLEPEPPSTGLSDFVREVHAELCLDAWSLEMAEKDAKIEHLEREAAQWKENASGIKADYDTMRRSVAEKDAKIEHLEREIQRWEDELEAKNDHLGFE